MNSRNRLLTSVAAVLLTAGISLGAAAPLAGSPTADTGWGKSQITAADTGWGL